MSCESDLFATILGFLLSSCVAGTLNRGSLQQNHRAEHADNHDQLNQRESDAPLLAKGGHGPFLSKGSPGDERARGRGYARRDRPSSIKPLPRAAQGCDVLSRSNAPRTMRACWTCNQARRRLWATPPRMG